MPDGSEGRESEEGTRLYYYDSTYLFVLVAVALSLIAQGMVKSAYSKYSKVPTRAGQPASRVVDDLLRQNGNNAVTVRPIPGTLTDHYDPRDETLSLSDGVYNSSSVAALGIAAHEAGHAMQKKEGYGPLALRSVMVPVVQFGSHLSMPIILLGFLMSIRPLITIGIVMFGFVVAFSLITLPVEFDASRRAVEMLSSGGYIDREEEAGVRAVLRAAAMTYVAGALGALLQMARLILLSRGGSRRRD